MKECLACFAPGETGHSAICLAADGQQRARLDGDGDAAASAPDGDPRQLRWLALCDPAITKAGLAARLATDHNWSGLRPASGLLLAGEPEADCAAVRWRRILAVTTCQAKALRSACREHGIAAARVVDRGAGIDARGLQRQSGLPPDDEVQLICSEQHGHRLALLTRPAGHLEPGAAG